MTTNRLSPSEWLCLRRLHRAGCRIDPAFLKTPNYPLRLQWNESELESEVFPALLGIGFLLSIRIMAVSVFRIETLRFQADWLPSVSYWSPTCKAHPGRCCIHTTAGEHPHFLMPAVPDQGKANVASW
jgi:hypothetical protein